MKILGATIKILYLFVFHEICSTREINLVFLHTSVLFSIQFLLVDDYITLVRMDLKFLCAVEINYNAVLLKSFEDHFSI